MGLNFEGMMLNQYNLIRVKGRTSSSLDPHQNCVLDLICIRDEKSKEGLVFGGRYLLLVGQVR